MAWIDTNKLLAALAALVFAASLLHAVTGPADLRLPASSGSAAAAPEKARVAAAGSLDLFTPEPPEPVAVAASEPVTPPAVQGDPGFARLRGIYIEGARRRVIVASEGDEQILQIGDRIDDAKIAAIARGSVVLRKDDGETLVLRIEDAGEPRP